MAKSSAATGPLVAAMQQIADWLEKLGLSEYAQRFAENDIDMGVLPDLTDQHLKDLGVSLGHRLKILRAIRDLSGAGVAAAAPPTPVATEPTRRDDAERRQLTVMFCDLVGSTALSARLDPEDMRSVIGVYHKCVAETVARFDGFVAKYMGDGVLIYFGYPEAHEDDAERAVRTGLALIEAVSKLRVQEPLQVRIGVATGLVVVGDLLGSGEAQERGVVGETPNLAARLQGIAAPNTVVIAEGTRRLLGNLFELEGLGPKNLKGIDGPARAWRALRTSSVEGRFEALHANGLTAPVGREEELELLLRRWSKAKTGEGQVVLIAGEAGIGKSRLTAALMERLGGELHTRLRYFCSPQHTDSAFYPIIGQMERAGGLVHDDVLHARLDKLDALLAQTSTSIEDASLFADLLSLRHDGRYPALELTPAQRRQRVIEALTSRLARLARQNPVLMIVEDTHWIDPTSLEVFGQAVNPIKTLPVLLIVTFRPEFNAPWVGQSHVTSLTVNRLGEREAAVIISRIVGKKELPPDVVAEILERTDGIPLFVEEITKAVLEADTETEARRTAAAVPSSALGVPASLHASLMARLDRLGPAKEVAQIAAAIGREFSHALLASVVHHNSDTELSTSLARLIQAGLLFRQGEPPHATYLFKHALVQDAAYGTLLREPRRALHARIAEALEGQFADSAETRPELLAHHYTQAGQIDKAVGLWGKAGQQALARSALVEATGQLNRALSQLAALPATPDSRREQLMLQVSLAYALMHTKGHAARETMASFDQARALLERADALGEPLEDPLVLFSVLYGFWVANYVASKADALLTLASQFLALAETQKATIPLVIGHRIMGTSLLFTGDIANSRAHYDRAIALYDAAKHRPLATRFGQDAGVAILSRRSLALWVRGYPEAARADVGHAIKNAREIGHAATLMYALAITSLTLMHCGDYASAKLQADEQVALADEKTALYWKAYGMLNQGCVSVLTGGASDAVEIIGAGITAYRSTGSTVFMPLWLSYLAKAYAELGRFNDARRCIGEALAAADKTRERWCEANIYLTAGRIALMSPGANVAKAEALYERALAIAGAQQAKSWELRAAASTARLWFGQGKRRQAHDLLASVVGWFTEGLDTLDLKEAKSLLDELAS
jgi:class 3 adenylate cyclase/predicted ATPase